MSSSLTVFNGVSKELQNEIKSLNGITDFGSVYMMEMIHKFSQTGLENANRVYEEYKDTCRSPYTDEQLQLLTEEHSIMSYLYDVDDFIINKLEIVDGKVDFEKFKTGNYVIAFSYIGTGKSRYYDIGDKILFDF